MATVVDRLFVIRWSAAAHSVGLSASRRARPLIGARKKEGRGGVAGLSFSQQRPRRCCPLSAAADDAGKWRLLIARRCGRSASKNRYLLWRDEIGRLQQQPGSLYSPANYGFQYDHPSYLSSRVPGRPFLRPLTTFSDFCQQIKHLYYFSYLRFSYG